MGHNRQSNFRVGRRGTRKRERAGRAADNAACVAENVWPSVDHRVGDCSIEQKHGEELGVEQALKQRGIERGAHGSILGWPQILKQSGMRAVF